MTENVKCPTCGGRQTWSDSDDGDWFACPDCWTPENVECPHCDGMGHEAQKPCPECDGTGWVGPS